MGTKISELTALTTPVAADLLVIVDTTASPDTTKKITITSLSTILAPLASPTFTGTVTLPAVTLDGNFNVNGQILDNIASLTDNSANPASSGFLRCGHGVDILMGRNNANNANRILVSWARSQVDTLDICKDGDKLGFFGVTGQAQQATIADADGTLADITTKFNTLLGDMEGFGLLASV